MVDIISLLHAVNEMAKVGSLEKMLKSVDLLSNGLDETYQKIGRLESLAFNNIIPIRSKRSPHALTESEKRQLSIHKAYIEAVRIELRAIQERLVYQYYLQQEQLKIVQKETSLARARENEALIKNIIEDMQALMLYKEKLQQIEEANKAYSEKLANKDNGLDTVIAKAVESAVVLTIEFPKTIEAVNLQIDNYNQAVIQLEAQIINIESALEARRQNSRSLDSSREALIQELNNQEKNETRQALQKEKKDLRLLLRDPHLSAAEKAKHQEKLNKINQQLAPYTQETLRIQRELTEKNKVIKDFKNQKTPGIPEKGLVVDLATGKEINMAELAKTKKETEKLRYLLSPEYLSDPQNLSYNQTVEYINKYRELAEKLVGKDAVNKALDTINNNSNNKLNPPALESDINHEYDIFSSDGYLDNLPTQKNLPVKSDELIGTLGKVLESFSDFSNDDISLEKNKNGPVAYVYDALKKTYVKHTGQDYIPKPSPDIENKKSISEAELHRAAMLVSYEMSKENKPDTLSEIEVEKIIKEKMKNR